VPVLVSSYHFLEGPLIACGALGVIILICRWVFSTDHRVPTPTRPSGPVDYGLLQPVAVVRTAEDAEMLREVLRGAGIRGTVSRVDAGFAVLVFADDAGRARDLVRSS
jgi:hypothetical protein